MGCGDTRICEVGAGIRKVMRAGARRTRVKNSLCGLLYVDAMHVQVT